MGTEISIGAIVFKKSNPIRFSVLKRADKGIWDFAKGHRQEQETEIHTLHRELQEEIGITNFSIIPNFKKEISYISSRGVKRVMVFYLVYVDKEICISSEHSKFKWISLSEAPDYFPYNDIIELLKKCEERINTHLNEMI